MKRIFLFFLFISFSNQLIAQNKKADAVVVEGKKLYKSEMASWHGTDIFLEQAKEKTGAIGGYFSYVVEDKIKCVFVSKGTNPIAIGTITFDSTFNLNTATLSKEERNLTERENSIFSIRQTALQEINKDPLFQHYEKTNFNIVPLSDELGKRVYVLTGSTENGVVMFGNDYLIKFNNKDKVTSKESLHASLIPFNFGENRPEEATPMHNHLPKTGDLITATDICTIMLYQKMGNWKQYIVISKNKVNVWNSETNSLLVMDKDAVEKILNK